MNKSELSKITDIYYSIENLIMLHIQSLYNFTKKCDCREPSGFVIQSDVDEHSMEKFCLNCGGYIEW